MRFKKIKQVISNWDPIGLLDFAPDDEYDEECKKILNNYCDDPIELGITIFRIFNESFGEIFTDSKAKCTIIANEILKKTEKDREKTGDG